MSSRSSCFLLSTAVLLSPWFVPLNAWGDEEESAASPAVIRRFLEISWETGSAAQVKADERFTALEETVGSDVEAYYARALVCLHQRRYDESVKALDRSLALDPKRIDVWRAKAWLSLLMRNYGASLAAVEKMTALVSERRADDAAKKEIDEAVRFLGAIFGFYAGPAGDVAATASRAAVEKRLLEALDDERRAIFKDARQDVLEKHASLSTAKDVTKEKVVADAEVEKQRELLDIENKRDRAAARAKELKERREKLQSEYREEMAKISAADQPLLTQLSSLDAQAGAIRNDLANVVADLNRLEALVARERDPVLRDRWRRERDAVGRTANRISANLDAILGQAASVQSQRAVLASKQAGVERTLGGEIQNIDRENSAMAGEERKLANKEKQALKPATGSTGRVHAMNLTASALTTYEPFPLEAERQRLLDRLK